MYYRPKVSHVCGPWRSCCPWMAQRSRTEVVVHQCHVESVQVLYNEHTRKYVLWANYEEAAAQYVATST